MIELLTGDCRDLLPTLPEQSVQTIVTSPPYWRLRKYSDDEREIGQEATIAEYVRSLVEVFMLCWRVLRDDGVCWLNIGDAYARGFGGGTPGEKSATNRGSYKDRKTGKVPDGLSPKSLIGLPWRVAFALQDAGWILRSEIIWHKTNGMPESVDDRPTRAHEQVFLFVKRGDYYYDAAAIAERATGHAQGSWGEERTKKPKETSNGRGATTLKAPGRTTRNARSVWSIPTSGLPDEHYAPMPQALAERCIKAGSRPGDTVLDPFAGSGTTGRVAAVLQRRAILIDLAYQDLQARRTDKVQTRMEL